MEDDGARSGRPAALTITFTLSRGEAIGCYRALALRKPSTWAFIGFGIAVAGFGHGVDMPEFVVAGLVFAAVYALITFASQPATVWRRNPELHQEQVIHVSHDGVTTELANRQSTADWTFWTRASRIGDVYVIGADSRGYCFIPRRSLSADDEIRLTTLLADQTSNLR